MKIRNLPYIFVYAILIIYAIITLIPFLWTVLSSFKTYAEIVGRGFTFLPKTWTLGNYKYLLGSEPLFLRWIFNSVFIVKRDFSKCSFQYYVRIRFGSFKFQRKIYIALCDNIDFSGSESNSYDSVLCYTL